MLKDNSEGIGQKHHTKSAMRNNSFSRKWTIKEVDENESSSPMRTSMRSNFLRTRSNMTARMSQRSHVAEVDIKATIDFFFARKSEKKKVKSPKKALL